MSAGVTFGSVGDIISVSIVIKDAIKALSDSGGSSTQYQQFIQELWAFDRVLLEIEWRWRAGPSTLEMNALRETTRRIAAQSRQSMESFLQSTKKYGPSLRGGGSGQAIKDMAMKVTWRFAHADDVTRLRAEINAYNNAINTLLLDADLKLTDLNRKSLDIRLTNSEEKLETLSKNQLRLLEEFKQIKNGLEMNRKQIWHVSVAVANVSQVLRRSSRNLKDAMQKLLSEGASTYKTFLNSSRRPPRYSEKSLVSGSYFLLEDGIGRVIPFNMEFVNSWDIFDAVLELIFRGVPGHNMIMNNEYVIEASRDGSEVSRSCPWDVAFLPGQRFTMTMLVNGEINEAAGFKRVRVRSVLGKD